MPQKTILLRIEDLRIAFGGVNALAGVSLEVKSGDVLWLIGRNGAGKTVLLNCVSGLYKPQAGRILYDGNDISSLRPHQRAHLGISRTFQKIELFSGMTVLDNIRLGRHVHMKTGLLGGAVYAGPAAREEVEHRAFIEQEIID